MKVSLQNYEKQITWLFHVDESCLSSVTERYEKGHLLFHTPTIKHKFAKCGLHYCLVKQLNS